MKIYSVSLQVCLMLIALAIGAVATSSVLTYKYKSREQESWLLMREILIDIIDKKDVVPWSETQTVLEEYIMWKDDTSASYFERLHKLSVNLDTMGSGSGESEEVIGAAQRHR